MAILTSRRHSDPSKGAQSPGGRNGKGRASSSDSIGPNSQPRRETLALASVPEDMPSPSPIHGSRMPTPLGESMSPNVENPSATSPEGAPGQRRWSRRLSWIPGWSFAGSAPITPPTSPPTTPPLDRTTSTGSASAATRLGRFRSSVSVFSEVVLRDTEPTHESNFPENPSFPSFEGRAVTLHVYGTIDSLTGFNMRLQTPRGFAYADFTAQSNDDIRKQDIAVMEQMKPLLRNGDLVVRPFIAKYARDGHTAMVVRGAIQDTVFKGMIVGGFPMKMFEKGATFSPYEMEVQLYDAEMTVAA